MDRPKRLGRAPGTWLSDRTEIQGPTGLRPLAGQISEALKDKQTLQPSEEDIVKAYMRYADYQRKADQDYNTAIGSEDDKSSWSNGHRWVKREA